MDNIQKSIIGVLGTAGFLALLVPSITPTVKPAPPQKVEQAPEPVVEEAPPPPEPEVDDETDYALASFGEPTVNADPASQSGGYNDDSGDSGWGDNSSNGTPTTSAASNWGGTSSQAVGNTPLTGPTRAPGPPKAPDRPPEAVIPISGSQPTSDGKIR